MSVVVFNMMISKRGGIYNESERSTCGGTVAESHKVELTFGFGRERSHASVVYGFWFPGSDYP